MRLCEAEGTGGGDVDLLAAGDFDVLAETSALQIYRDWVDSSARLSIMISGKVTRGVDDRGGLPGTLLRLVRSHSQVGMRIEGSEDSRLRSLCRSKRLDCLR